MIFRDTVINEDLHNEQSIITVSLPDSKTTIEAIQLVAKNNRYRQGLGNEIYMDNIAGLILSAFKAFDRASMLNEKSYTHVTECFKPFIHKARTWKEIQDILEATKF